MSRLIRFVFSTLTGILLSVAWLGFPGWTLFIAFIPLLFAEKFFVENQKDFKSVSFWGHAFWAMFVWNLITTWWVAYASLAGAVLAIVANSFIMSLIWWLVHLSRRNFSPNLGYLSFIVFLISFEYFHFHWDMEWPWLTLGNGFANNIRLVQWFEYTGFLGGTLWILIMNLLIFKLIVAQLINVDLKQRLIQAGIIVVVITVPMFVSMIIYNNYEEEKEPRNIVIVQPNVDPYSENFDREAENKKLENFISIAENQVSDSTDFIIGPETVFERYADWNEDYLEFNIHFQRLKKWLLNYENAELIFGVSSSKIYKNRNSAPVTAREYGDKVYDVFNSAFFIGRNGEPQIYHKTILVPGVEKMPFMKHLKFLKNIAIDLGGASGSLGRQEEPSVFISKDGTKIAPVICYESAFGEYVTEYVKKGAQLIFIITNDGWWRNTPGYKQHMAFARLRAIETRRSIARSANTGISCFINQRGDVFNRTEWWTKAAVSGKINVNDEITFYVRYGDYIARVSLFMSVLLLLFLISKNLSKK